jgi:putative transposase
LYLTNLTDEQWQLLCPVLEIARTPQKEGDCEATRFAKSLTAFSISPRQVANGGMLPSDFAPWRSVYGYFRAWKLSGVWDYRSSVKPSGFKLGEVLDRRQPLLMHNR